MTSAIDPSLVNPAFPTQPNATTQSVRDNFAGDKTNWTTAKAEISALQAGGFPGIAGTGIVAITVANTTAVTRALSGTANEITVTNGDGVAGNPTASLPAALTFTGKTVTGGTFASPILSGSVTGDNTLALSLLTQQAAHTVLGNATGSTANVTALSTTALTALVNSFTSSLSGAVPASGGGTTNFLRADGTWASAGAGSGTVTSIATNNGVTGGTITTTGTIGLASIADSSILANISGGSTFPSANTLTAIIDHAIGSTRGSILERGASAWGLLTPGTINLPLVSGGASADPAYVGLTVAGGGTGLTSGTSGGVLAFTASGTLASSAALTANLPVIGGGAGVAPTVGTVSGNTTKFMTGSGSFTSTHVAAFDASGNIVDGGVGGSGNLVLISTQTASSSATIDWTGLGNTYNTYLLVCSGVVPASNNVQLGLRFGTGAGPTWITGSAYDTQGALSKSAAVTAVVTALAFINLSGDTGISSTATTSFACQVWINNLPSTSLIKTVTLSSAGYDGSNSFYSFTGVGDDQNSGSAAAADTGIRLLMSSGNIASGKFSLYGILP